MIKAWHNFVELLSGRLLSLLERLNYARLSSLKICALWFSFKLWIRCKLDHQNVENWFGSYLWRARLCTNQGEIERGSNTFENFKENRPANMQFVPCLYWEIHLSWRVVCWPSQSLCVMVVERTVQLSWCAQWSRLTITAKQLYGVAIYFCGCE